MKKIPTFLAIFVIACSALAQPRAIGGYLSVFGGEGVGASYQHNLNQNMFLEADLVLSHDYGLTAGGWGSVLCNYIFAHPEWVAFGDMNAYAGAGIAGGWVGDGLCTGAWYDWGGSSQQFGGGMFGIQLCLGIEVNMKYNLSISMDMRPIFGGHVNSWVHNRPVGLYTDGLMMFCPSVGVRYRFH